MSSAQATGDRMIDGRADLYAVGAMLYEMPSDGIAPPPSAPCYSPTHAPSLRPFTPTPA